MSELPGQLPLFTLDGCEEETQALHADETCACSMCADSTQDIEYPGCRADTVG